MIDLKNVVQKYPECLENPERLRAYLTDLYPDEKAKVGIVVSIFSCGIVEEIEISKKIDDVTIKKFCTRLENDYGYSQKLSSDCIDLWLEVYDKMVFKAVESDAKNFVANTTTLTQKSSSTDSKEVTTKAKRKAQTTPNANSSASVPNIPSNKAKIKKSASRPTIFKSLLGVSIFTFIYTTFILIFKFNFTYASYEYDTNVAIHYLLYVLIPPVVSLVVGYIIRNIYPCKYFLIGSGIAFGTGFILMFVTLLITLDIHSGDTVTFNIIFIGLFLTLINEWLVSTIIHIFKEKLLAKVSLMMNPLFWMAIILSLLLLLVLETSLY